MANNDITFIVHKDWLDSISGMTIEQQDKIIADIVRYGVELPAQHEDDAIIASFVNILKGRIDYSKDKYAQYVTNGTKGGRPKKARDEDIWTLARNGMTASEIAKKLGYKDASSITHNEGWKQRKNSEFIG